MISDRPQGHHSETRPDEFVLSSPAVPTDSEEPRRYVDLERREDRFIIYVRDTRELIEALNTHTRKLTFPDTPVTRTVYFGDPKEGTPAPLSLEQVSRAFEDKGERRASGEKRADRSSEKSGTPYPPLGDEDGDE